jgi:signal transduction histidine kinase
VRSQPLTSVGLDVKRLISMFIILVVVPTVGLVAFGVLAINNERAAVEQRFKDQYAGRLRSLAEHLAGTLETTARRLNRDRPSPADPLVRFDFTLRETGLESEPPRSPDVVAALSGSLHGLSAPADGSTVLLPIQGGAARGLYAVRRLADGNLTGLAFSEQGLAASVAKDGATRFPGEAAHFTLEGPKEALPNTSPLRTMLESATIDRAEQNLLSLPLPAPLGDWHIVANLPGDDPVRSALWRNRTIYIVTLALFYVVIAIGVVITLRGIYREVQLSRMKTDFVSNISHELRTPLTSIRMFAETLRQGRASSPEEQAMCIDFIAKESERLSLIAERTLDWARLEAGRRPFVREQIDPAHLLRGLVEAFLSHGTVDREAISLDVGQGLPLIDVDTAALGQVVLNLLENAVKYSGPEKRITVRARRRRRGVLIEVADNGFGIARKDLKRVFERFYRADDLLARRTEGSGLGLSIARRIVVAHAGRLTVVSKPGVGSTFSIFLPAVTPIRRAAAPTESPA